MKKYLPCTLQKSLVFKPRTNAKLKIKNLRKTLLFSTGCQGLFFILIIIGLLLPFRVIIAANPLEGPIVPCGREGQPKCTLCHFFVMAKNIIDLLTLFIVVIAPVFIVIGAVVILTSAGSPDKADLGKQIVKSAIIGVIIALLSWAILSTLFNALVGPEVGPEKFPWPWNKPNCPV